MLKLYTASGYPTAHGNVRSTSAFSWKAEALLILAGLPFEREYVTNIANMPKGKIPVLDDNGVIIPDSSHIQRYLTEKYGFDLDAHLSREQKAVGEAFRRLAEEHLHWVNNYAFFIDPAGKDWVMKSMLGGLPQEEADGFYQFLFDKLTGQLHAQGLGRHSREEIYDFGRADVDAVKDYLGDKDFLFGSEISSADLSVATIISVLLWSDIDTPLSQYARSQANLTAYAKRFDEKVFR
ncbi:glutathione S-transferase family protein [Bergeriella denitrificans]|uniref:GST N-terminal domain-containing protein n=1 Tax=Bergeriella denitrificans TaxID=494 RepID=A0A378UJC5_BERDE|nr:glutathione S-transferase family protein [Bergeriella denitrificans]STZ77437.1 Uncharacterised protein [Bergeriella denitrificans]